MKTKTLLAVTLLATLNVPLLTVRAQGTAFTYQGRLSSGGTAANGLYDFQFAIYDASSSPIGSVVVNNAMPVSNGLFTVTIDAGPSVFNGAPRWLEVSVRTNGSGTFSALLPRQAITPAPYASFALNSTATLNNFITGPFATVGGGQVNAAAGSWTTVGGGQANASGNDYSTVGGGQQNVSGGKWAAIGGGQQNHSFADWATVAGGLNNESVGPAGAIGGGQHNTSGDHAFVGGGYGNMAAAPYSVVGGGGGSGFGEGNTASAPFATVAGGMANAASGLAATVGGGSNNFSSGQASTVPGGKANSAGGFSSFAAGYRAKANHQGSFVWGDSTEADFGSTTNNQFLIRASGGVGIGTTNPGAMLQVGDANTPDSQGMIRFASHAGIGAGTRYWDIGVPEEDFSIDGKFFSFVIDDPQLGTGPEIVVRWDTGNVGIGATNPAAALHVAARTFNDGDNTATFQAGLIGPNLSHIHWGTTGDWYIRSAASNGKVILQDSGGNVGIGTTAPNAMLHVTGSVRMDSPVQIGSGTGTEEPPDKPVIVRRIKSTISAAGSIVARTDKLRLERDGSSGGWRISNVDFPGSTTITATGLTSAGTAVNFVTFLNGTAAPGITTIFSDAQSITSFRCTFGDTATPGHLTEVSLIRGVNNFWTGTVTSTFNQ